MSYPMGLDEYTWEQLIHEVDQRVQRQALGMCDYCVRPLRTEPYCRMYARHQGDA